MEEWERENLCFLDYFGMNLPCSASQYLEVCLFICLEVANKYYFGGKKIGKVSISDAKILKENRKNVTKVIYKV